MQPKVSFIIPFYNSGSTIEDAVNSALGQHYPNFDIWIVNDGSSDQQSLMILEGMAQNPKVHVIHQENQGPSIARTTAIKQTDAEYLALLDADNIIRPDTLNIAMPILTEYKHVGMVYGDLLYFGEGVESRVKKQEGFSFKKALVYNQIDMASIIKKEVFEKSGYFDEYMSKIGLEDWEFWINMAEQGWTLKHVDEVLFEIRVRKDSRTFMTANPNLELLKNYVYQKHSKIVMREYEKLYYEEKMLRETPDYRIGNWLMRPWRIIKKIFKN